MNARFPILFAAAATLLSAAQPTPLPAHEVPATATARVFVHPESGRMILLARVPLESMRDIALPLRGPGYLELAAVEPVLREAALLWVAGHIVLYEDGRRLPQGRVTAARVSLPSDETFREYGTARALFALPSLDPATELPWQQALLDVLIEVPISSPHASFAIEPTLAHLGLRTTTVLHFVPVDGPARVYTYDGDPGRVRLDPRWHHAAATFVRHGFLHILGGLDHLLFLLCLVIPLRRLRGLVIVVTSFTAAHSITLVASALGAAPDALWFPPLIEALIAASIVYMALENIIGARVERRWLFAFGFGLVHGFGFAFTLRESLQFAGSHVITSLVAFNTGVELGQIAVLLVAVPALGLLFRHAVPERIGAIVLSAIVAHTAWHWMTERVGVLREYEIAWPAMDAAFAAAALRGVMALLIVATVLWGVQQLRGRALRLRGSSAAAEPRA